jgi:hypothetical protein
MPYPTQVSIRYTVLFQNQTVPPDRNIRVVFDADSVLRVRSLDVMIEVQKCSDDFFGVEEVCLDLLSSSVPADSVELNPRFVESMMFRNIL